MKLQVFITVFFLFSCTNNEKYNLLAENVGGYLINGTHSKTLQEKGESKHLGIVRLGQQTIKKLQSLNNIISSKCYSKAHSSGGEETNQLFIICNDKRVIGFRLKYDAQYEKFHVLGYWTSGL